MTAPLLVAVMGPTASGKTRLAETLATELDAVLVNADAFQVYRGLDIGTAKPKNRDRYSLLDLREPNERFGLGEWLSLASVELGAAYHAGRSAIVAGGTGLYIRALFEEYAQMSGPPDATLRERLNSTPIEDLRAKLLDEHPDVAATVDLANPVRVRRAWEKLAGEPAKPVSLPGFRRLKLAINPPLDLLEPRIEHRVHEMVQNGWAQEIDELRKQGFRQDDPGFRAIGYRALWSHLERKISLDEAIATTIVETRRYAKRQRTWLRTEPNLVELSATTEQDAVHNAMERIGSFLM